MNNQEAIEIIEAIIHGMVNGQVPNIPITDMHSALKKAAESLKENEWVPMETSEEGKIINRLPEEGEQVLITIYGGTCIDTFGCDVEYDESTGEGRNEWYLEDHDIEDVKAWMPLPKPYKAEKGEPCEECECRSDCLGIAYMSKDQCEKKRGWQ